MRQPQPLRQAHLHRTRTSVEHHRDNSRSCLTSFLLLFPLLEKVLFDIPLVEHKLAFFYLWRFCYLLPILRPIFLSISRFGLFFFLLIRITSCGTITWVGILTLSSWFGNLVLADLCMHEVKGLSLADYLRVGGILIFRRSYVSMFLCAMLLLLRCLYDEREMWSGSGS